MSTAFAVEPAMRTVSLYEAKTHLSALIEAVERGESITITKHGHPAAQLVPVGGTKRSKREVVDAWLAYRATMPPIAAHDDGFDIADRSTYGHRY